MPFISTHPHVTSPDGSWRLNRHSEVISVASPEVIEVLLSLLNSSAALFWLKQVCYNKGAGGDADRDRYEFAGGKVEQLPVPSLLLEDAQLRERAGRLAQECSGLGEMVPRLHPYKLFERPGEAYIGW